MTALTIAEQAKRTLDRTLRGKPVAVDQVTAQRVARILAGSRKAPGA